MNAFLVMPQPAQVRFPVVVAMAANDDRHSVRVARAAMVFPFFMVFLLVVSSFSGHCAGIFEWRTGINCRPCFPDVFTQVLAKLVRWRRDAKDWSVEFCKQRRGVTDEHETKNLLARAC